jgi:formylglycine-generating enzyme required for sulfatase activity
VWEWCNDWFDEDEYRNRAGKTTKDPQGPQDGRARVLRGGSFINFHGDARCAVRDRDNPFGSDSGIGFRVCVSPILKSEL